MHRFCEVLSNLGDCKYLSILGDGDGQTKHDSGDRLSTGYRSLSVKEQVDDLEDVSGETGGVLGFNLSAIIQSELSPNN